MTKRKQSTSTAAVTASTSSVPAVIATPTLSSINDIVVPLSKLGIAKENPRYGEEPDEDIELLAESLDPEVGVLLTPLFIRAGDEGEDEYGILNGRRRFYALKSLEDAGRIPADFPVACRLFTDPATWLQAAVTPNDERFQAHISQADIILTIAKYSSALMSAERIARALGYGVGDIKQYLKVKDVDANVLEAFRLGQISFTSLKIIARQDQSVQSKIGISAMHGDIQDWQITNQYDDRGVLTTSSPIFCLVGLADYTARGGAIIQDMFEEKPDFVTNQELAYDLWREAITPIVEAAKSYDLKVFTNPALHCGAPEGYTRPVAKFMDFTEEERELRAKKPAAINACNAVFSSEPSTMQDRLDALTRLLDACIVDYRVCNPVEPGAVIVRLDYSTGVNFELFADEKVLQAHHEAKAAQSGDAEDDGTPAISRHVSIPTRTVNVDVKGSNNAFHRKVTVLATKGLQHSLASDGMVALKVDIAERFKRIMLVQYMSPADSALHVNTSAHVHSGYQFVEGLDQQVVQRLLEFREQFKRSEQRLIPWVNDLDLPTLLDLNAHLVAMSLNLVEERTDMLRLKARAEAQEIAELLGHDIKTFWLPGDEFYQGCTKKQLLGYLTAMGAAAEEGHSMKKDDLARHVAEQAAAHNWAPPNLNFENYVPEPEDDTVADEDIDPSLEVEPSPYCEPTPDGAEPATEGGHDISDEGVGVEDPEPELAE